MSETLAASTPSTLPGPLRREARADAGAPASTESRSPGRRLTRALRQVFLGPADDPRWARPLLAALLLGTTVLYLLDLSSSGTANDFYAAAVKSGTESLKAWFFGSLDSANAITVDKPPAALWLMVLSARILGFSSFSMLLPQALLGVGSVALLYAAVRRWVGPAAGLIAGALLAITPVAALMFRFNNPDAMLVFLMVAAAYCVVRAIEAAGVDRVSGAPASSRSASDGNSSGGVGGRPTTRQGHTHRGAWGVAPPHGRALRWMLLAGSAIGFAFLTKMAQGLLVLPAFGLVYLVASPLRLRTRIAHLLAAAGALVVSAGWFIALVELWPAAARPYIGGSSNNSLWELAIGYNGLSRLLGGAGNGSGGGGPNFGGSAGLLRMFGSAFGTQIAWFLPAALLALVAGLVLTRRAPRTDKTRAALLLWGAWLVVSTAVFSFMSGTIHPYYSVALAPAIGALVAIGGHQLWIRREARLARGVLAVMIGGTAVWGSVLMIRDANGWLTWLAYGIGIVGVLAAALLAVSAGKLKRFAVAALLVAAFAAASGAASFTVATVATGHTGSTPTAGPSVVSTGGMGGGAGRGFPGGGTPPSRTGSTTTGTSTGTGTGTTGSQEPGGQPGGSASNTELVDLLNGTSTRWSAAVIGDQSAAGYILSTNTAVMAIGGWSGSDSSPTLAEFQAYVASGQISYFIVGGNTGGGGGGQGGQGGSTSSASAITAWVEASYTATTVGGTTVYDLTAS